MVVNFAKYTLTEEERFQLMMEHDNKCMVLDEMCEILLEDFINNGYEEFNKDEDYESFYQFLSDKLETVFYNLWYEVKGE